jgi:hypothetical protein
LNNKQRFVLIIGAAVFLYALFTSPKVSIVKGTYVTPPPEKKDIAKIVDISTAMTRAFAILGATLLVSIALKDKKRVQTPPSQRLMLDGRLQECEKHLVKNNVIATMIRFLKDFF